MEGSLAKDAAAQLAEALKDDGTTLPAKRGNGHYRTAEEEAVYLKQADLICRDNMAAITKAIVNYVGRGQRKEVVNTQLAGATRQP